MDPDVRVCVCAAAFYVMYCDATFFLDTSSVSSPVYAYMGVCVSVYSVYAGCINTVCCIFSECPMYVCFLHAGFLHPEPGFLCGKSI